MGDAHEKEKNKRSHLPLARDSLRPLLTQPGALFTAGERLERRGAAQITIRAAGQGKAADRFPSCRGLPPITPFVRTYRVCDYRRVVVCKKRAAASVKTASAA